jgi:UrcA family protein
MNKLTSLLYATAIALTVVALPAAANDEIITKSTVVRFGDLNLESEAGARTLYERIRAAARQVCDDTSGSLLFEARTYHACFDNAVNSAVNKVNRPTLWAMYRSGNSHPTA